MCPEGDHADLGRRPWWIWKLGYRVRNWVRFRIWRDWPDMILRRSYWARCRHRSHRWPHKRTCLRVLVYQGHCRKHNRSCFTSCDKDAFVAALVAQVQKDGWPRYKVKRRKEED